MASGALVILGIILVVLGVLGGGDNLWLIIIGLLAILAGGVLQVAAARRT